LFKRKICKFLEEKRRYIKQFPSLFENDSNKMRNSIIASTIDVYDSLQFLNLFKNYLFDSNEK